MHVTTVRILGHWSMKIRNIFTSIVNNSNTDRTSIIAYLFVKRNLPGRNQTRLCKSTFFKFMHRVNYASQSWHKELQNAQISLCPSTSDPRICQQYELTKNLAYHYFSMMHRSKIKAVLMLVHCPCKGLTSRCKHFRTMNITITITLKCLRK